MTRERGQGARPESQPLGWLALRQHMPVLRPHYDRACGYGLVAATTDLSRISDFT
jgi:hypothetical protein